MEVEMKIRGLTMDPVTQMPIVVLKDINGSTVLPIWVGIFEANAIALEIEKVSTPRPMTHDLIKTVLMGLDTGVKKIVVSELKDDTFYALIWLEKRRRTHQCGFAPERCACACAASGLSDLRGRFGLKKFQNGGLSQRQGAERRAAKWLEGLNDEDLGRYKM